MSRTASLYERAMRLMPGGTQLLSKQPERFHPRDWPAYYRRASGAEIEDLDGRRWIDVSIHGIGACPLGYADSDVEAAVLEAVRAGAMSTLNAPEEVELAELLCDLHPFAEQVRYARSGGEAMAMAVRIARAATGRERIAFSGYHGWHDWYLAANLEDPHALDDHLLPGLDPAGVPKALRGSAVPFDATRLDSLDRVLADHGDGLAAIVMEPGRYSEPTRPHLLAIRERAERAGCPLIFDEITSGFRLHVGGLHQRIGVEPDVAVFAKALGNGHPIAAVIGRRSVMEAAERSFISSTNWTDRVGPAAALATIRKLRDRKVPDHLIEMGDRMRAGWLSSAAHHGLELDVRGLPPMPSFHLSGEEDKLFATLYTQLMLDRGYLASNSFYATFAHDHQLVDDALAATDAAFAELRRGLDAGDLEARLHGPLASAGPRRRER